MGWTVNSSTRRYRSELRAEQARDTRRRILDAATRLFVANGDAGTTVNVVAAEPESCLKRSTGCWAGRMGVRRLIRSV